MAEESKIIDEVVSQAEETQQTTENSNETEAKAFDASAFTGYDKSKKGNTLDKEALKDDGADEPNEQVEEVQDNAEPEEQPAESDSFSWDDVKTEEKQVEAEKTTEVETEEDWDEVEQTTKEPEPQATAPEIDWSEMGQELNVNAKTKEEFVAQVKQMMENPVKDNDVVGNLKEYLDMSDRDLVIADLKAANYDDDYVNDTVDRMEDAGLIKREATTIRHQLNKHIMTERQNLQKAEKEKTEAAQKESVESRKNLQKLIKGKDEFFGGKVSQNEKKNLYNYIIKGDFAEDIFSNHANVADAAFLWRNKEKIFKMMRTQGVEQGKSSVLNGITSPSSNTRNSKSYKPKSDKFDPSAFTKK